MYCTSTLYYNPYPETHSLYRTCIAIGFKLVAGPTVTLLPSVPVSLGFAATYDIIHLGK